MSQSVRLDGVPFRPVPDSNKEIVGCTHCQERPARWERAYPRQIAYQFYCSYCLLYEIPPLKEQRESIEHLVFQVEKATRKVFDRDSKGCLLKEEDSDRIAFGVIMTQRYEDSRGLR